MIEHEGETRWCTADKKHTTVSHSRGCNCNNGDHSGKGGQEEAGCGAGKQRLEEDYDRGAHNCCLDATNARAKETAKRKLKKDTANTLQLPG
jgi:hypothetical protein